MKNVNGWMKKTNQKHDTLFKRLYKGILLWRVKNKYYMILFSTLCLLVGMSIMFSACQSSFEESTAKYYMNLVESRKITFPIDENTYYNSKCIFQFEKDNKEYLSFQNTEKRQYDIQIYDISSQEKVKAIPMQKQGPNGVPSVFGVKYVDSLGTFLLFQSNFRRITMFSENGEVLRKYKIESPKTPFIGYTVDSYYYNPSFLKDSVLYLAPSAGKPNMKKEDWRKTPMLLSLNLETGEVDFPPINYPSIFNQAVKNLAAGADYSYDYNSKDNRLVCSFISYDSIMVTDDLHSVKWFDGKSRYLEKNLKPRLAEASEGFREFAALKQSGHYFHLMYDKYRDVYYRFVEHPCEPGPDEYPLDDPKAREFSVIIFDKELQILGETKFQGNKYYNKMSFVGRDGLYISENNLANPEFDEDKLVFACFKLEDIKNE